MKIFIDTNIFLDLILKRQNYKEALKIFNAISKGIFIGVILDITILNIDYIAKKQVRGIKDFLEIINGTFIINGADNKLISKALKIKNNDLEDNLQYLCAKENSCKVIITNDKKFYNDSLELLSSVTFVKKYL